MQFSDYQLHPFQLGTHQIATVSSMLVWLGWLDRVKLDYLGSTCGMGMGTRDLRLGTPETDPNGRTEGGWIKWKAQTGDSQISIEIHHQLR